MIQNTSEIRKALNIPGKKDMIPSKYEGSILEDDIVEEPFKIEVGANMKTLEQLVIDTIAQNLQSYKVNAPTAAKIASEIREWMREQNGGLWEVIDTRIATLQAEQPYGVYSINDTSKRENLVEAILSVIPPREPIDKFHPDTIDVSTKISPAEVEEMTALLGKTDTRTLEQVIEEASRSVEATEARVFRDGVRNQYETIADAVREWLSQHNFAILQANRIKELEAEVELLKSQKCAKPDVANCAKEWEAQHQFRALQEHGLDEEFPYGIDAIQHVAEALVAARAEVERYKDIVQEGASLEVLRTQRDKAAKYDALCETFPYLGHPEVVRIIREKANKYDELREKFPFLPGEEFWVFHLKAIRKFEVASAWRNGTVHAVYLGSKVEFDFRDCYASAEECRAAIKVEE